MYITYSSNILQKAWCKIKPLPQYGTFLQQLHNKRGTQCDVCMSVCLYVMYVCLYNLISKYPLKLTKMNDDDNFFIAVLL